MIPARDLQRVELDGAQPGEHGHHALAPWRQGTRRCEKMPPDEEQPGRVATDLPGTHGRRWYAVSLRGR